MYLKDPVSFELQSYKDLFKKAQHDLAQLEKRVNSYDLFNFICTLNHLHDWVEAETGKNCPRDKGSDLELIQRLCNRAKHFRKVRSSEKGKVLETAPDTKVQRGFGISFYGRSFYGSGEPSYIITRDDGTEVTALVLCRSALAIWEDYLKREGRF